MDTNFKRLTLVLLGFFVMAVAAPANAQEQTLNDAKKAIQKGDQEKRANNYEEAIAAFEECIQICNQLGDQDGVSELKTAAEKKVTKSNLDYGNELLKQNKYDQALERYNKTVDLAEKYELSDYLNKAKNNIPDVYYAKGKNHLSESKFEEAIELFNKAIEGDPDYGWAYIRKAQAYRQLDNPDAMEKAVKEATAIGKKAGENEVVNTAQQLAYKYFYNNGAKSLKNKNYAKAIPNLEKALEYGGSPTLNHYLAVCYSQESQFEDAVEREKKVIEALKGNQSEEDLAKYYYSLGSYYEQLGQTSNACSAYRNAAFGKYKENAEYKINNKLNCD
ncbi:MAG: tetratricopeptide repeat protein [Bacteroidales bacterium]|nr:tetratricopeptide repeat protein [Bacteroidales bacterium]